jgi:hypothetical protein
MKKACHVTTMVLHHLVGSIPSRQVVGSCKSQPVDLGIYYWRVIPTGKRPATQWSMADDSYWDGKVHKAVTFGDSFDSPTVEDRKKTAQLAAKYRLAKAELEALRVEERSWSFWRAILNQFRRG